MCFAERVSASVHSLKDIQTYTISIFSLVQLCFHFSSSLLLLIFFSIFSNSYFVFIFWLFLRCNVFFFVCLMLCKATTMLMLSDSLLPVPLLMPLLLVVRFVKCIEESLCVLNCWDV